MKKIFLLLALIPSSLFAQTVKVSWLPNFESDLRGYKVYYGVKSRVYNKIIDVGMPGWNSESREEYIVNVSPAGKYYFTVTAYDEAGNESGFSNESSVTYSDEPPPSQDDLLPPVITEVAIATDGLSFIITWKSTSVNVDKFQVLWSDTPDRMRWRKTLNKEDAGSSGQYYTKLIGSSEMIEGNRYYFAMTTVRGQEVSNFSDIVEEVFGATDPPPISDQYEIWAPLQIMVGDSGEIILKFRKKQQ